MSYSTIIPVGTRVERDLPYVAHGHPRQTLDLYVPAGRGPWPLIIWVHGGGWAGGSKDDSAPLQYLARGYAIAAINYRLSQHAVWPAQIVDCLSAVRWLRAHAGAYRLDAERFAAWGASAGGHLVTMLALARDSDGWNQGETLDASSAVQAIVDYFGPTDFLLMDEQLPAEYRTHSTLESAESRLLGGDIREHPDRVADASPLTRAHADAPPFLILHGDSDTVVPCQQSELLEAALRQAGAPVELVLVPGAGHGMFSDRQVEDVVTVFLQRTIGRTLP